jgi:hypothetical protein
MPYGLGTGGIGVTKVRYSFRWRFAAAREHGVLGKNRLMVKGGHVGLE